MKTAFLFPGQGSQFVGMGKDLYEEYDEVKKIYDKVEEVLGIDIKKISFEGPEEELNQTKNTQIAILTMSLAILEVLKKNGIKADVTAGLSLGEYSALISAGYISFEDGIQIVKKRGEIMQNNIPEGDWLMAGVLALPDKDVEDICKEVSSTGFIAPTNYNTPGEVVISGERNAVKEASEKAMMKGAKKVAELKTAGPFHTEKMKEASIKLKAELDKVNIKYNKEVQVIKNIDGTVYTDKDNIQEILAKHIMHSVRFKDSITTMLDLGIDTFVEIGPRKIFIKLCKKS